jgi:hypothetical protein
MRQFKVAHRLTSYKPALDQPACGIYVDLCAGKLWSPRPNGGFELFGDAHPRAIAALIEPLLPRVASLPTASKLVTFAETARLACLSPKTLYEWKRTGKLRREHGLRVVGRNVRIEWSVFKAAIDGGELS